LARRLRDGRRLPGVGAAAGGSSQPASREACSSASAAPAAGASPESYSSVAPAASGVSSQPASRSSGSVPSGGMWSAS
jgi:hypothetical protein